MKASALFPLVELKLPTELFVREESPIALFLVPVVFLCNAAAPMAKFLSPVLKAVADPSIALDPMAMLKAPPCWNPNAEVPIAIEPVVTLPLEKAIAAYPKTV